MLKFLSRGKINFNALDHHTASFMEFLAHCQVQVKRTDDEVPKIHVTVVNGIEEVFDATSTPTQTIGTMILEKGQMLQPESMFGEAGESRPVIIPDNKLQQLMHGTK
ncbi:hypothetical protein UlMin_004183, partial [Ulmus minor]